MLESGWWSWEGDKDVESEARNVSVDMKGISNDAMKPYWEILHIDLSISIFRISIVDVGEHVRRSSLSDIKEYEEP